MGTSEQKVAQNYVYFEAGPLVLHFHRRGHWSLEYIGENEHFKVHKLSPGTARKLEYAMETGRAQLFDWAQEDA